MEARARDEAAEWRARVDKEGPAVGPHDDPEVAR